MDISKHLERANEAVRKKNFDFALTLYNQALAIKPDHREARLGLLEASARKLQVKPSPKILRVLVGIPQFLSIFLGKLTKNSDLVARAAQRYLMLDPHNDSVNFLLGKTLESSGYLGGAAAVYEFVAEYDQKNIVALKKAGFLMYRLKDVSAALELFEKVLAIAPRDPEAEKMRKNLAAEDTLATGSYSKAKSSIELVIDKEEAASQQKAARIHRDADELDEDEAAIRQKLEQDPGNKRAQRDLGDLLMRKKEYDGAFDHFRAMLENDPNSFDIRCLAGDAELLLLRKRLGSLRDRMAGGEKDALRDEYKALRQELIEKQIKENRWRVDEHPTDLSLWFKLGKSVFTAGRVDEAIEAFQHSVKDPRHKIESLRMLGSCFREKGLFDLAMKQFKSSLEATGQSRGQSKEIIYDLGDVAERMGDREGALDWFSKIYEIDINYKDVATKIESLKES